MKSKANSYEEYYIEEELSTRKSRKAKYRSTEKRHNICIRPTTVNQSKALDSFRNNIITVLYGSAGVGKSYLSTLFAMEQITLGNYDRLIICRANVPTGRTLGAFPGTIEEKLYPWLSHIIGYCKDCVGVGVVDTWMRGDHPKIIMEPIETIRGRSYDNAIILIEEAQQLTFEEIKAISTRIGRNSKMIMTGDPSQRDTKTTALEEFITIMRKYDVQGFDAIRFTPDDIVRSDIVKSIILAFENEGV